ncbi:hypothetical protein SDC9_146178 [bioreactor metagenome]|uniref:Uncharacterized protein n=1 Tax=bioreactor metagenome TaxID=1076179 RepID=A0A645ED14_9ZZZZ
MTGMRMMVMVIMTNTMGAPIMVMMPTPPLTQTSLLRVWATRLIWLGKMRPSTTARAAIARDSNAMARIFSNKEGVCFTGIVCLSWFRSSCKGPCSVTCPEICAPSERLIEAPTAEISPSTTAVSSRLTAPPIATISPFTEPVIVIVPPVRTISPLTWAPFSMLTVPPTTTKFPSRVSPYLRRKVSPRMNLSPCCRSSVCGTGVGD